MHALGLARLLGMLALSALRVPGPLSPRNASYQMKVALDPVGHTVVGHEKLTWRNVAREPATQLVFHLYMNAFKNQGSTFFRESKGLHRRSRFEKHGWGSIDVQKVILGGRDVTAQFTVDDTLATLALAAPVAPGATVEIELDWKTTLPKVYARTGYHDDYFAVAQWFPKIGVWDCDAAACRWRAHQHHLNSEFFADYGVYDVELALPTKYWVGATGVVAGETQTGEQKTIRFHAEDVHDFAFVAYPRFAVHEDHFIDDLGAIRIELLSIPGHEANVARHLAAAKVGLAELRRRFGPYPYSQLTIVDVPEGAEGAGGMEYPTLFFTFDLPVPAGLHLPELVTIHELSHQYFYGLVGSDEVEEAWLDEGFTETMTDWGLGREFGPDDGAYRFLGHHMPLSELNRTGYRQHADLDPLETRAFDFIDNATYARVTYSKTDVTLRTLEGLLGAERFERAMRHYYEQWRFRHPRIDDFVRSFDEGAGEDLSWFWTPALRSSDVLDYEVLSLDTRPKRAPEGLFAGDGGVREVELPAAEQDPERAPYVNEVVVHRRGEWVFPVELRVKFADGSERREKWDGGRSDGARWKRWTYEGTQKVTRAEVDPERRVALDVSRWNDGRLAEPDGAPRRRIAGGWSALVSTLLAWVGF